MRTIGVNPRSLLGRHLGLQYAEIRFNDVCGYMAYVLPFTQESGLIFKEVQHPESHAGASVIGIANAAADNMLQTESTCFWNIKLNTLIIQLSEPL